MGGIGAPSPPARFLEDSLRRQHVNVGASSSRARGDLKGPPGYSVRGHLSGYGDVLGGAGLRWAEGGVAEELYISVTWGLFVRYRAWNLPCAVPAAGAPGSGCLPSVACEPTFPARANPSEEEGQ